VFKSGFAGELGLYPAQSGIGTCVYGRGARGSSARRVIVGPNSAGSSGPSALFVRPGKVANSMIRWRPSLSAKAQGMHRD